MKKRHQQKLVILSIGIVLLVNIPLVFIFNSSDAVLGFPLLYFYLFSVWLISILLTALVLKRHG